MAITAAGLYGPTLEKFLINGTAESLEAEDNKGILVADGYTPDYNVHDFVNDLTNELTDGDYARQNITTTEITLSGGVLTFDADDTNYGASVTLTAAMAQVIATEVGLDSADELVVLQDFVTAASSSSGSFVVQHAASGIFTIDYTP